MNTYVTDKEQIEMIRNWWRENGTFIVISIITAIVLSTGWRYWQNSKNQKSGNASHLYELMLNHENNHQLVEVEDDVNNLTSTYSHTPYASLAAFMSAKNAISSNQLGAALLKYNWIINQSKNPDFKQIAKIRKARVLLTMQKFDEALDVIKYADAQSYFPLIQEIKGDILLAQGNKKGAREAYQQVLTSLSKNAPNQNLVQMKYDQSDHPSQ